MTRVSGPSRSAAASADPNLSAFSADRAAADLARHRSGATGGSTGCWPAWGCSTTRPRSSARHGASRAPGVLLALPALVDSGVFDVAREVYGSIGPAFYGLRTTIVALLLMALLRIKRPEGLKEHPPDDLGPAARPGSRARGQDPAAQAHAAWPPSGAPREFGRALAERRVAARGAAMGFLYVDGHVRVYHGKRTPAQDPCGTDAPVACPRPPTTGSTTRRESRSSSSPLRPTPAWCKMLPDDPRRGRVRSSASGASPSSSTAAAGARSSSSSSSRRASTSSPTARAAAAACPGRRFCEHDGVIDGRTIDYMLADQGVRLLRRQAAPAPGHAPFGERPPDAHRHLAARSSGRRGRLPHVRALAAGELLQVPARGVRARRAGRLRASSRTIPTREVPNPALERRSTPSSAQARAELGRLAGASTASRPCSTPSAAAARCAASRSPTASSAARSVGPCAARRRPRSNARAGAPRVPGQRGRRRRGRQARHRAQAPHQPAQDGRLPGRERPRPARSRRTTGAPRMRAARSSSRRSPRRRTSRSPTASCASPWHRSAPRTAPAPSPRSARSSNRNPTCFPGSRLRLRFAVATPTA